MNTRQKKKMVCEAIGLPEKQEKNEPDIVIPVSTTTIINQKSNAKELLKSRTSSIYKIMGTIAAIVVLSIVVVQMASLQKAVSQLSQSESSTLQSSSFLSSTESFPQSQQPTPSERSDSSVISSIEGEGTLVYVTRTGDKYHKLGCSYIKNKTNLLDLYISEAQDKGYLPCSACFPK